MKGIQLICDEKKLKVVFKTVGENLKIILYKGKRNKVLGDLTISPDDFDTLMNYLSILKKQTLEK